jgi:hypothetical protein
MVFSGSRSDVRQDRLFTFGGGYALVAMIEDACVEKKQWITHDDMMNVTVIANPRPDRSPSTVPPTRL